MKKLKGNIPGPAFISKLSNEVDLGIRVRELRNGMFNIITGNVGVSVKFPQVESDLEKIDDVKRNEFFCFTKWALNIVRDDVAKALKDDLCGIEQSFVSVVNKAWGSDAYDCYIKKFEIGCNDYDIPSEILNGCSVSSILDTPSDFFPSDADRGFDKKAEEHFKSWVALASEL